MSTEDAKLQCCGDPCIVHEKSKEKEKRFIECSSPGCTKKFHAVCIGHEKASGKELKRLFFVCLSCEDYLNYSAEIARKSLVADLDNRLDALKTSILETVDLKISRMKDSITQETKLLCDYLKVEFDRKLNDVSDRLNSETATADNLCGEKKVMTDFVKSEFDSFKQSYLTDIQSLHASCQHMSKNLNLLQMDKRKECFIIRNFPEKNITVNGSEVSNCKDAVRSIAKVLGLEDECQNIQNIQRLGKVTSDGKPRLMKVKSNANTSKLFLQNARKLKNAPWPLNKVFLQADLPIEVNRRLAEMRKRAFGHRNDYPDESAYVKNLKLYINDVVVDEIKLDF